MRALTKIGLLGVVAAVLSFGYLFSYGQAWRHYRSTGMPNWLWTLYRPADALVRHDYVPHGRNSIVDRYRAYLLENMLDYRPRAWPEAPPAVTRDM